MCAPHKQLSRFCFQCAHLTSNRQGFAVNVHTSEAIVKVLFSMCTPHKQLSRFCFQCAHLTSNCQGFAFNVHTSQAINKVLLSMCTPLKQLSRFCFQCAHLFREAEIPLMHAKKATCSRPNHFLCCCLRLMHG